MNVKKYRKQIERKQREKKRRNSRERKCKETINWGGKIEKESRNFVLIKEIKMKK